MVLLAQSSPGCRPARALQSKTATVMLEAEADLIDDLKMGLAEISG
jgi:hypothetical protein